MKFVTVRELRNKPAQVRQALLAGNDMVLTSNGKPFAIITPVSEEMLEKSLAMLTRVRAENALASIQKSAGAAGLDTLTETEIEEEIASARKVRR